MTDAEIARLIEDYVIAAKRAKQCGYDFVDIKHCHGYLGHEFLSAHTREGRYGGAFENRTRFLREIVEGIRAAVPGMPIAVRVSAFDVVPFKPDPARSQPGKLGPGIPEIVDLPYRYGFGIAEDRPTELDLTEPKKFLALLRELGVTLVNITSSSPYYNPHTMRPALYPPSDGYHPPEEPLIGVARHLHVVRDLKAAFPDLTLVGSAYTYLQEFLPHVAQAVVRQGWTDFVGLGRMVLAYPELPHDVLSGKGVQTKRLCRTFSDCTTAPRNGLVSGCYPLDAFYKKSPEFKTLAAPRRLRSHKRRAAPPSSSPSPVALQWGRGWDGGSAATRSAEAARSEPPPYPPPRYARGRDTDWFARAAAGAAGGRADHGRNAQYSARA